MISFFHHFLARTSTILLCLFVVMALGFGSTTLPAAAQSDADKIAEIDSILERLTAMNLFSGSVLVGYNGDILLSKGYGLANREWDTPNTVDTKFRIAYITMQFTAAAILVLQQEGSLNVQDSVCDYIDDCSESWQPITIHHLLTHTSGIFGDLSPLSRSTTPQEKVEWLMEHPLIAEPGTVSALGTDYIVLGYIIEQVSGLPYGAFLRDRFFDPLGMRDTGYEVAPTILRHRADGYGYLILDPNQQIAYVDPTNDYSAQGLYSTVEDLYRWDQALYGGEILSDETWDLVLDAGVVMPMFGVPLTYGFVIEPIGGHPATGMDALRGSTSGFNTTTEHLQDHDFTVIVLENLGSSDAEGTAEIIVQKFFGTE